MLIPKIWVSKIRNLTSIFLFMLLLAMLPSCTTVPYTERDQFLLTSESHEMELGQKAWDETLRTNEVSTNKEYRDTLDRVGVRLASAVDKKNFTWEFMVLESDIPNAFCLPGGKIAVYDAMFKVVDNDPELAAVVGHEIAHAIARHGGERMSYLYTQQLSGALLSVVLSQANVPGDWGQVFGIATDIGVILPYSRVQEYEADHIGMIIMAKAGYSPEAAITFWEKYAKEGDYGTLQEFFTTHPMGGKRLKEMKKLLPKAMKYYNKAPLKTNSN